MSKALERGAFQKSVEEARTPYKEIIREKERLASVVKEFITRTTRSPVEVSSATMRNELEYALGILTKEKRMPPDEAKLIRQAADYINALEGLEKTGVYSNEQAMHVRDIVDGHRSNVISVESRYGLYRDAEENTRETLRQQKTQSALNFADQIIGRLDTVENETGLRHYPDYIRRPVEQLKKQALEEKDLSKLEEIRMKLLDYRSRLERLLGVEDSFEEASRRRTQPQPHRFEDREPVRFVSQKTVPEEVPHNAQPERRKAYSQGRRSLWSRISLPIASALAMLGVSSTEIDREPPSRPPQGILEPSTPVTPKAEEAPHIDDQQAQREATREKFRVLASSIGGQGTTGATKETLIRYGITDPQVQEIVADAVDRILADTKMVEALTGVPNRATYNIPDRYQGNPVEYKYDEFLALPGMKERLLEQIGLPNVKERLLERLTADSARRAVEELCAAAQALNN